MNKIRVKTVLAYLYQKGWEFMYETENFNVLKAPNHFQFDPDPYFSILKEEYEETDYYYDYLMDRFATLVAGLYELDKDELVRTWSKTAEDLKADIQKTKELLTYVS